MSKVFASMSDSKTRYKRIVQAIVEEIRQGELRPGQNLGGLEALAARWEVSPGTVRQSLQILASAGLVTRKPRVGTVVSEEAPSLVRGEQIATVSTKQAYALLVPNLDVPEYVALVRGLNGAVHARGEQLRIFSTSEDRQQYADAIEASIAQGASGIILVPPSAGTFPASAAQALEQSEIPVVTCWRGLDCINAPVVCGDPFDQMHTSTKYLLSLGLKKIGFVTGSDASIGQHMSTMGQYGYERALLEARLEFVERRIHIVGESFMGTSEPSNIEAVASIRQGFAAWLRRNEDLEGVVCGNDLQAAMIIRAAEELGRRVPEGLSVTGAGNLLPYFRQVVQSLTTLDVQIDAFGGKILELFDEMEAGVKFAPGYRRTVKANLVVGTTTRKPGATSRK